MYVLKILNGKCLCVYDTCVLKPTYFFVHFDVYHKCCNHKTVKSTFSHGHNFKKKQDQSIAHDCWICMATVVICYFFYLILIHFGIHKHMGSTILIMDLQNAESLSLPPFGCQFPFCFAFAPTDVFHLKLITHELITIGRKMKNRLLWIKG